MRRITIHELKQALSARVAEAEADETLLITRRNLVVAKLVPRETRVHVGTRCATARLRPALDKGTGGRYLEILADDRAR